MGNLAKGVRSESANVGAKWPERNSLADAQSLKPRPALRSGFCSRGMTKAPSTTAGVSFNNSRRLMVLNLRLSVCVFIGGFLADDKRTQIRFANQQKVTTGGLGHDISSSNAPANGSPELSTLVTIMRLPDKNGGKSMPLFRKLFRMRSHWLARRMKALLLGEPDRRVRGSDTQYPRMAHWSATN